MLIVAPAKGTKQNVLDAPQQVIISESCESEMGNRITLKEVDGAEIVSLMDNTVDLGSTVHKKEASKVREWTNHPFRLPYAEHGFSVLIKTISKGDHHTILFDTGLSPEGIVTNATRMGVELSNVEGIVLSHGHYDHFGGLAKVSKIVCKEDLPIIVHDNVFKTRGMMNTDGSVREFPKFPAENQIAPSKYVRRKHSTLLGDKTILVSGEIPRKTDFEKGFKRHYVLSGDKWLPDPWIWDDQAVILNIKYRGLVIITGCAHAGIVNTALYAQQITGVTKVYSLMGGFHLAEKDCETRISQTIELLQQLNPKIIVPMHCTGWRGKCAISKAIPYAFVSNSVGNLYRF
jgi:7,8-dihydropterin-6-yl-methyl-4-(beta-D-ribofuranosyl)aminobenzene 5'-phosphate synthase